MGGFLRSSPIMWIYVPRVKDEMIFFKSTTRSRPILHLMRTHLPGLSLHKEHFLSITGIEHAESKSIKGGDPHQARRRHPCDQLAPSPCFPFLKKGEVGGRLACSGHRTATLRLSPDHESSDRGGPPSRPLAGAENLPARPHTHHTLPAFGHPHLVPHQRVAATMSSPPMPASHALLLTTGNQ